MTKSSAILAPVKNTGTRVRWMDYSQGEAFSRTGTVVMVDPTNEYGREIIGDNGECYVIAAVRLDVIA